MNPSRDRLAIELLDQALELSGDQVGRFWKIVAAMM